MKEDESKLCLIYYVVTERYEHYIPFFLYFLGKAYPNINTYIAIRQPLCGVVKDQMLPLVDNKNYKIEIEFQDYPIYSEFTKILRWIVRNDHTDQFEYLYYGDIDIFIMKQKPSLMESHLARMNEFDTFYSNGTFTDIDGIEKMTGIHFCKRKEWYNAIWPTLVKYRDKIRKTGRIPEEFNNPITKKFTNLWAFTKMVEEAGIPITKGLWLGTSGLHLGNSREPGYWKILFNPHSQANDQINFFRTFRSLIKNDIVFNKLLELTIKEIREEIKLMIEEGNKYIR